MPVAPSQNEAPFPRSGFVHAAQSGRIHRCLQIILKPNLVSQFVHKHPQFGLRRDPESSKSFQEPQSTVNVEPRMADLEPAAEGRL